MIINKSSIVPIGRRLLIEPFKQASETTEGLIMSEGDGVSTPVVGTVLRTGEGCRFKETDVLLFRRYSVDSLKVYDEESEKDFYLLEESEIIAQIVDGLVEPPDEYHQIKEKIKLNQDAIQRRSQEPNALEKDSEESPSKEKEVV